MLSSKVLLSLTEVSTLVGLSLRTTTKLIASGEIKSIRVGRRRLARFSHCSEGIRQTQAGSRLPRIQNKFA